MSDDTKAIADFARKVKRIRTLEQRAYNALSKGEVNAEEHERAMVATSIAERDLASLVIRLLVNKKPAASAVTITGNGG